MFNLRDPETTDKQKELAKFINNFVLGHIKQVPKPTHQAPVQKQ